MGAVVVGALLATRAPEHDVEPVAVERASVPEVDAAPPPVAEAPPPPCPDAELRARIDEGKRLIATKKYEAARLQLDDALACRPDDPEALAERGRASFLLGDLDRANEDLALASRKTKRPDLLGAIWYSRALVDEADFSANTARPALMASIALGRHAGARKKLDGMTCDATLRRVHAGSLGETGKTVPDAGALVASLDVEDRDRRGLGADGSAGRVFPDVLHLSDASVDDDWLVAKGTRAAWAFRLVNRYRVWQCKGESTFTLATQNGLVHAHGFFSEAHTRDKVIDHGPHRGALDHGCFDGPVTGVDAFFDPKREVAIVVRRPLPGRFAEHDDVPGPAVIANATGIAITGFGCDESEPWDDPTDETTNGGPTDATTNGGPLDATTDGGPPDASTDGGPPNTATAPARAEDAGPDRADTSQGLRRSSM